MVSLHKRGADGKLGAFAEVKHILKSFIRNIAAGACHICGYSLSRLHRKTVILMYHRVLTENDLASRYVQPGMYVTKDVFEMQMKFLKEHFEVISLRILLDMWDDEAFDAQKRYCVITFDDGWLDNYINAFPVLKKYNLPATIFLPTAFIGKDSWFWPDKLALLIQQITIKEISASLLSECPWLSEFDMEQAESIISKWKRLPEEEIEERLDYIFSALNLPMPQYRMILSWQEVKEMSIHEISFGSHSVNHRILTNSTKETVQKEVEDSMHVLKQKRINYVNVFCYPNGGCNEETAEIVKEAGYKAAVTTEFGFENGIPLNPYSLKRIGVHNDISSTVSLFTFHLSGAWRKSSN
jgi:peptidoglycan/xylan/chitin deacetylase (PgdA/CDA1 family)